MKRTFFSIANILIIVGMLLPAGGLKYAQGKQPEAPESYSISGRVTDGSGSSLAGVTVAAFPSSNSGEVTIQSVSADYDLAGYYPVGLGEVNNKLSVTVDWGGKTPSKARFKFNDTAPVEVTMTGMQVSKSFRFDQVLKAGSNTLQITAVAADGSASAPRVYQLQGWTAELGWLQQIAASLPYVGPDKIEFKIYVPGDPISMDALYAWLMNKPTKLQPQAVGKLSIPLRGGRYQAGLGVHFERDKKTPGRKPWYGRNALSFLGNNDLETDFMGQFEGNLTNSIPYLDRPDLINIKAQGKVTFEIAESVLIVLYPISPAGPVVINTIKSVPPVYDWIKDIAKFYVEFSPELGGELTLNWGVQDLEPIDARMYLQFEVEGG